MKKVVYNGYLLEVAVPGCGRFTRGVPKEVSEEVADRLLTSSHFEEVKPGKAKAQEVEAEEPKTEATEEGGRD